jgi:pseudouridine kinase
LSKREIKQAAPPNGGAAFPLSLVVGGANIDIKVAISGATIPATSNPGTATVSVGGVGRNIAHNLARLGTSVRLISAVGRDPEGDRLLDRNRGGGCRCLGRPARRQDRRLFRRARSQRRAGDRSFRRWMWSTRSRQRFLGRSRAEIEGAAFLVADCNLHRSSLQWLQQCAKKPASRSGGAGLRRQGREAQRHSAARRATSHRDAEPAAARALTGRELRSLEATQHAARSAA